MKSFYTTLFLSAITAFVFAQETRRASLSDLNSSICKTCTPKATTVLDTLCNLESDDTLVVYYADAVAPYDSGWAYGHNAYADKGWAERFTVFGNANVIGGAYLLYERSGIATSGGTATGKVYTTTGPGGKPGTSLGSVNIPFSSMSLSGFSNSTFFTFASPVAVTNSFFMAFELGNYALGGPDTIGIVTSRGGNRSTTNNDQNCALWSNNTWRFELTENFRQKLNYGLCAIVDILGGMNDYVSKGDLKLYATYPNPGSSSDVTISYSVANVCKTAIEIFDVQGKSMMKIDKGNIAAGKHFEKVDVSSLPAGSYLFNVSTETGTLFSRFTIVK